METILVVDDEADVCELARDCLVAAGYRVLEARDGEEALRIAEGHTEPIHLLDRRHDATSQRRRTGGTPDPPAP